MVTVGAAGDWDRESENHGLAIFPLLGWQKLCPRWKQSLIGNDPNSLHQQETPPGSFQEPWLEDRMTPTMTKSCCHCCQPKSQQISLLILQPLPLMNILVCCHESQSHDQISLIILALEQQLLCGEMSCCYILFKFRESAQFCSIEHQMFGFTYFSYILRLQQSQQAFMRIIKDSLLCFDWNKQKENKLLIGYKDLQSQSSPEINAGAIHKGLKTKLL